MSDSNRRYRVCHGKLVANDVAVPIHRRVLKVGLVSAGIAEDPARYCKAIPETLAMRILAMERSVLLSGLQAELSAA